MSSRWLESVLSRHEPDFRLQRAFVSFRLMASGKFRIDVLVAVTDSSGDIEDDRDTFESLAHGILQRARRLKS